MTHDRNITKTRGFKKLMIFLLVGIAVLSFLFFKVNKADAFDYGWTDDLDTYLLGTELHGQGGWTTYGSVKITNEQAFSSPHSFRLYQAEPRAEIIDQELTTGILEFKFYDDGSSANGFGLYLLNGEGGGGSYFSLYEFKESGTMTIFYDHFGNRYATGLAYNTWHTAYIEWNCDTFSHRIAIDSGEWSEWFNLEEYLCPVAGLSVRWGYWGVVFFDDFNVSGVALPPMKIWGIDPVSGTEVSDLNLDITIGYEGFDWDEYDGFTIAFWDERLHASSKVKVYIEDDLDPSGAGEVIVNLTDFGLDKKGKWYLTGLGFGTHLDIQSGMFLTTLGFVDFWSGELVDPEYYFIVVAEELPDLYPISDFEIWYGDNVVEFLEPTSFALAIAGFFQPILEKIGEFHERTQIYLDTNEAYSRGQGLGDVFPILTGYVANISYFMGGFPLVSWFKYILIVLFAIFIIRTIFKFIPFFG